MACTYTFQTYRGEETITGMANMKAFLVLNGVDAIGRTAFKRDPMAEAIAGLRRQQTEAVGKVQSHVNTITQGWANAPQVEVVYDMNDERIPEAVRRENERQLSQGAEGQPEGFFTGGRVFIVASEMRSADDVARVLFHESLGHFGLRGFYGRPELNKVLDEIALLRKADIATKAKQYGLNLDKESDRRMAAEEVLAEMAQTRPEIGFVKRAIAAIRAWLRENVPYFNGLVLTDDEIIRSYLMPARNFVERGTMDEAVNGVPAFNRRDIPDSIKVNGIDRPTRNSKGDLIYPTEDGIKNFWGWFDDVGASKRSDAGLVQNVRKSEVTRRVGGLDDSAWPSKGVLDREGRPTVLYHGTSDSFDTFEIGHKNQKDLGWLGNGIYLTNAPQLARFYAEQKTGEASPNIMPLYAAIKNPYIATIADKSKLKIAPKAEIKAFTDGLKSKGYDGVLLEYNNEESELVAFESNQIKSATGNNGIFNAANDSILFSRSEKISEAIATHASKHEFTDKVYGWATTESARTFGADKLGFGKVLKNIRTQYDKAVQDPDGFGRMFRAANRFELDARTAAARPSELAPSILGADAETMGEAVKRVTQGDKFMADREKVADYLFEGTLAGESVLDGKVFSDAELQSRGATPEQIKLYREARKAVDQSLQESAASLAYHMVKSDMPELKDAIMADPNKAPEIIRAEYNKRIDKIMADWKRMRESSTATKEMIEAQRKEGDRLILLSKHVKEVFEHVRSLQKAGYMPLSRFGDYSLTAYAPDGSVAEFYRFETEADAMAKAKELNKSYPRVERGVMPTNQTNIFAGADPETVALFVEHLENTGFDVNDDVFQEWYKAAVSDRSALKRMIERKGTAGFDRDVERVLASFITSNSRFASSNYNRGDMLGVLEYLKTDPEYKRKGDVYDESKALFDYVTEPKDPFTVGRSLMFTWFMGGSLASAAVNLTQPLTMTFPELAGRVGSGKAKSAILAAMRQAGAIVMRGKEPEGDLGEALKRAREIGLVDPQQTHHLFRLGAKTWADRVPFLKDQKVRMQGIASLWGMMFARAESLNRYNAFIAAYNLAKQEKTLGDPFAFAKEIVEVTQGIYSKENRPNWARGTGSLGTIGAMAFTFKQYSIAYLEMMARNYKRGGFKDPAVLWQLGILMLLGGAMGVPFADDGEDLADTVLQFMGGDGNTRRSIRNMAYDALGEDLGAFALYGVSAFMPFDIQGRMGMGNLIPASDVFKPSNQDRTRSVMELIGAPGSLASDSMDALQGLGAGKTAFDVLSQFAPVAIKNAFKGGEMSQAGFYDDTKGRRVVDTDGLDAFFKAIGFQPAKVAESTRVSRTIQQSVDRARQVESQIAEMLAKAQFEDNPDMLKKAKERLQQWNTDNPDLPIVITPRQVIQRLQKMRMTREERQLKSTPRELRQFAAQGGS